MAREATPRVPRAGGPLFPFIRGAVRRDLVDLLRLAGPVIVSRLGIMGMGLIDTIVVGRYSAVELGYVALGWAPTSVAITVSVGLLSGVQVMTARVVGEGRPEQTGAVLRRGLTYAVWIGLVATVVLMVAGPPLLHAIGLERSLADGASRALMVFALSMVFQTLSNAMTFWLEAMNRPGMVSWAMWAANGVNLVADLILVPGALGLPALGAVGSGYGTLAARLFLTVVLLAVILRTKEARALGLFAKPPRNRADEVEQRRVGYGAGASNFFEVAAFAGMNVVAGWLGALQVAAWAIVLNVAAVIFMVPLGLSAAAAVIVGRAYGARHLADVNRAGAVVFAVTAGFGLLIAVLVWPSATLIARGYTADPQAVALAAGALVTACLFFLPDALQAVAGNALRARGDVLVPSLTHMASYVLVMMPLAWLLAIRAHLGLQGIVLAVIVASLVAAGLLLGRYWMLRTRL